MTIKNGFDIRVSPKIHKKNRMFTVLNRAIKRILNNMSQCRKSNDKFTAPPPHTILRKPELR